MISLSEALERVGIDPEQGNGRFLGEAVIETVAHHVTVETTTEDPFYPGCPGYYAECDVCGKLAEASRSPRVAHVDADYHLKGVGQ